MTCFRMDVKATFLNSTLRRIIICTSETMLCVFFYVLSKGALEYVFLSLTQVPLMRIIILMDPSYVLWTMWCKKRVSDNDLLRAFGVFLEIMHYFDWPSRQGIRFYYYFLAWNTLHNQRKENITETFFSIGCLFSVNVAMAI